MVCFLFTAVLLILSIKRDLGQKNFNSFQVIGITNKKCL